MTCTGFFFCNLPPKTCCHPLMFSQICKQIRGVSHCGLAIYLWRKVVCFVLFCDYEIHQTRIFRSCSWCLWKAPDEERCAWAWFHYVWTCSAKVLEYWMISSLKMKLNHSWRFGRNWNVPLVLLERSWWEDLMKFIYKEFKLIFCTFIKQISFKKLVIWIVFYIS